MVDISACSHKSDTVAETNGGKIPEKEPSEIDNVPLAVDKVNASVWIVAIAGAAERFCYYALATPLRKSLINLNYPSTHETRTSELTRTFLKENYLQNQRDDRLLPGAFGLGQQTATNLSNVFLLIQFVAPVPFAIVSDTSYGRYKTLMMSLR